MMPEELEEIALIEQEAEQQYQHHIDVCVASGCMSSQSDQLKETLEKEIHKQGEERWCRVRGVGCMGLCTAGPLVAARPTDGKEVLYQEVKVTDSLDIVESLDREPVNRLICPTDVPFFERQHKVVMENAGRIDPERIEDYISAGGYSGLLRALTEMAPSDVTEEVGRSGLRGRGGGGYPTALKWTTVAKAVGGRKFCYLQCR